MEFHIRICHDHDSAATYGKALRLWRDAHHRSRRLGRPRKPHGRSPLLRRWLSGVDHRHGRFLRPAVTEMLIAEALYPYPRVSSSRRRAALFGRCHRWEPTAARRNLRQACEHKLEAVRLERIDLYHSTVDPRVPWKTRSAHWSSCRPGKIRHIGVSNVNSRNWGRRAGWHGSLSVQNRYNLADRTA